jgi:hypothetical protein
MIHPRALFNASWFINGNLVSLVEKIFPVEGNAERRKLVVHIENAPAHNPRMTRSLFGHNPLNRITHPSYSHDILPPNNLFGKVKSVLIWLEIPEEVDLFDTVTKILNGI